MKKMPYEIKQEIRCYAKLQMRAYEKYRRIQKLIEEYDVPVDNLLACGDTSFDAPPQTEALAFINNCECDDIEGSIKEIEEVFLWFVNNPQN